MSYTTVMPYDNDSDYRDENHNAKLSDTDFWMHHQLYDEYQEARKKGFVGTYNDYLQCRYST